MLKERVDNNMLRNKLQRKRIKCLLSLFNDLLTNDNLAIRKVKYCDYKFTGSQSSKYVLVNTKTQEVVKVYLLKEQIIDDIIELIDDKECFLIDKL